MKNIVCLSGKVRYKSEADGLEFMVRFNNKIKAYNLLNPERKKKTQKACYFCEQCLGWHTTCTKLSDRKCLPNYNPEETAL